MPQVFSKTVKLMGNRFVISVVENIEIYAKNLINTAIEEISRIENIFTTFKPGSETNLINQNAGIKPVSVCDEMFELVQRAQRISEITDGAFDLSYGSLDKSFWNFDQTMTLLPDPTIAAKKVSLINYKNIILDKQKQSIFLKERGMRIGFGGIAKGYAADMAVALLQKKGVKNGIVNASGDLKTWGNQPNGQPWTIKLAHPDLPKTSFSNLNISNLAVATSGNYEKFVIINGQKYSHTINPKTGYPVQGIKSVSIICPIAELADALATPITIMGVIDGLHLINQLAQVEAVIITDNNELFTSNNIHLN